MGLSPENILLFTALALIAEVLGTVGGFGSSLFFVPIAGYFLDFYSVLGVTAAFHVCSNLAKISMFRHGFNKQLLLSVGIPAVIFVTLGAMLTKFLDTNFLQLALAVFLMVLSSVFLLFKNLTLKPTFFNSIGGGALSGFTAGLLGSGGAIRGLTLAAFAIEKNVFIATSAFIDLGVDLSRSVVYFTNGYMHSHDLYLIAILLLVSFAGTYLGKKVLNKFSESQFRVLVLSLIFLIGLTGILKPLLFKSQ
ncbi:MAG: sulfite exporter TauE/SafE family protein [Bacteroidia bacterium]|nr:sulfite exporter TauE/SafE family protein [Bacteroidia bacterium]